MRMTKHITEAIKISEAFRAQDLILWNHCLRTTHISMAIADVLDLRRSEVKGLDEAASYHDIGMVALPENIRKMAPVPSIVTLPPHMQEVYAMHVKKGYEYVKQNRYLEHTLPGVLYHHERWDGSGYPEGLKGEEIPLMARIIGVADELDSLVNPGGGRDKLALDWALNSIKQRSGTAFDPEIVNALLKVKRIYLREALDLFVNP